VRIWWLTGKRKASLTHGLILPIVNAMLDICAMPPKPDRDHRKCSMYLFDTDVLIDIQRGHAPAIEWFASLDAVPSVPGFVVMELVQDSRNSQQVRQARKLVAPLPVVWATEADCARALSDFTAYHLSDSLGLLDALIAACAVGRGLTLCTFNLKHYRVVPNLVMAQPYAR
jgi:predicted nucleic acid-binding protein